MKFLLNIFKSRRSTNLNEFLNKNPIKKSTNKKGHICYHKSRQSVKVWDGYKWVSLEDYE